MEHLTANPEGMTMAQIEISQIEVLALKKLALINGALAKKLTGIASREQTALLSVLIDVVNRSELANASRSA